MAMVEFVAPAVAAAAALAAAGWAHAGRSRAQAERRRALRRLARSEAHLSLVAEHPGDVIFTCDREGAFRRISSACRELWGHESRRLAGRSLYELVHAGDRDAVANAHAALRGHPARTTVPFRLLRGDGGVSTVVAAIQSDERGALQGTLRDVSAQSALEERLRHAELHDAVTGLANRRALIEALARRLDGRALAGGSPALLVVHVDGLRTVNNAFGSAAGDAVLVELAARLRAAAPNDRIARTGDSELAVVAAADGAIDAAKRIVAALHEPFQVGSNEVALLATIGIAIAEARTPGVDALLHQADAALLAARHRGDAYGTYDAGRTPGGHNLPALAAALRRAFDAHELELHYQPQVAMRTGQVIGVEALVRWRHPEHGVLYPNAFLELAEQTGQVERLTDEVVALATEALGEWERHGVHPAVAINLSGASLRRPGFAERLGEQLSDAGVGASRLRLELTESMLIEDSAHAADAVEALGRLGVELSIDDFGTGHSSLTRLRRLPLNELKIDHSFVSEMTANEHDAAIVRSTINLARDLGLRVVAEGVEDAETWTELRALGCDAAQGFHIAKPMPAGAFPGWIAGWEAERRRGIERAAVARKRSDEAMRETQRWYGDLFESDDCGVALQALDGRYLRVNRMLCDLLGRSEAKLLTSSFRDFTDRRDQARDTDALRALLDGDDSARTYEKRYIRADGTALWARVTRMLVRDEQAQPLHFVLRVTDVSSQKQRERELERLANAIEASDVAVCELDLDGVVTSWSAAAARLYGLSAEQVVGTAIDDVLPRARAAFAPVADGRSVQRRLRRRERDGSTRELAVTASPVCGPGGEIVGASLITTDVTREHGTHERLLRLSRLQEVILSSSGQGILGADQDGRGLFANPAATQLLMWPADELVDRPLHDALHHSDADGGECPRERCPILGALAAGRQQRVEHDVFWRRDGTPLAVSYTVLPVHDGPTLLGAVVVFQPARAAAHTPPGRAATA